MIALSFFINTKQTILKISNNIEYINDINSKMNFIFFIIGVFFPIKKFRIVPINIRGK